LRQNKVANINENSDYKFKREEKYLEKMHKFAYFSRVVTDTSGLQEDVKIYIHNTNRAFIQIYPSWNITEISTATKVNNFRRNNMYVHLNGCKIWKVLKTTAQKWTTFINRCVRKMLKVLWSNVIYNEAIREHAQEKPMAMKIKVKKW
jgi:hypothetical protein